MTQTQKAAPTRGRTLVGVAVILFGLLGGLSRLTAPPPSGSFNDTNYLLAQSARPLENAVAVVMTVVIVAVGLAMCGVFERRPRH